MISDFCYQSLDCLVNARLFTVILGSTFIKLIFKNENGLAFFGLNSGKLVYEAFEKK